MVLHPTHVGVEKVRDHAEGRGGGGAERRRGGGGVERRRGGRERREERRGWKRESLGICKTLIELYSPNPVLHRLANLCACVHLARASSVKYKRIARR